LCIGVVACCIYPPNPQSTDSVRCHDTSSHPPKTINPPPTPPPLPPPSPRRTTSTVGAWGWGQMEQRRGHRRDPRRLDRSRTSLLSDIYTRYENTRVGVYVVCGHFNSAALHRQAAVVPVDSLRKDPASHTVHDVLPAQSTVHRIHLSHAHHRGALLSFREEAKRFASSSDTGRILQQQRKQCMFEPPEPLVYVPALHAIHALLPAQSRQEQTVRSARWLDEGYIADDAWAERLS
jgi:hypothetical protein